MVSVRTFVIFLAFEVFSLLQKGNLLQSDTPCRGHAETVSKRLGAAARVRSAVNGAETPDPHGASLLDWGARE